MDPDQNRSAKSAACERVLDRLAALSDGGLLPLEEALDRGHLEACLSCAAQAESWTSFQDLLGEAVPKDGALDPELFAGLEGRLAKVVIQRHPESSARTRMITSLVGAAASLVVLFGLEALGAAMGDDRGAPLLAPVSSQVEGADNSSALAESLRDVLLNLFPKGLSEGHDQ